MQHAKRLRLAIMQVEAVMKMLSPEVNLRLIAPKRRNVGNPWFKRGTLYRAVIDTLRKATGPMTADDICKALLAGKTPAATTEAALLLSDGTAALVANERIVSVNLASKSRPSASEIFQSMGFSLTLRQFHQATTVC